LSKHVEGSDRWVYLAIATLSQVSLATIHLGIPAVIPLIQKELGLSLTEVGVIVSLVNIGVVASGILAGKAADRFGERLIIAYGTMAGGLIVMMIYFTTSFFSLVPVLLLLGAPFGSATPAGSKAVAGWFERRERGTAISIRQTGVPVGGAIAALVLPSLALAYGWRFALALIGVIAIGVGVAVLKLYKEPAAQPVQRVETPIGGIMDIVRRKDIWAVTLYASILAGCQWCYLGYIELYLTEDIDFPLVLAAAMLAGGQILGAVGRIVSGLASDRFFLGRRKPVLVMLGSLAIVVALVTIFLTPGTPRWTVAVIVAFFGFATMSWQGIYLTLVTEIAGVRMAGQAIGLTNTVVFFGIVCLPPVFGTIADYTASYQMAWGWLALVIAVPLGFFLTVKESGDSESLNV
jgi:sugar phosphate permease